MIVRIYKKYCLKCQPNQDSFFFFLGGTFFWFSIYKTIDSENSTEDYKSPIINIRVVMKNAELSKSVPDYLKTKKTSKNSVKKLYVICYWSI